MSHGGVYCNGERQAPGASRVKLAPVGRGGGDLGIGGGSGGLGGPGESGSGGAWESAFREHYPSVVRRVAHLLGDRAAAEDIAQETFLRLMRRAPAPRDGLGPWLRVVATRLAYNFLRGERRRRAREEAYGFAAPVAPARTGTGAGTAAAVRNALAQLPPRDRLALLMRAEGASYAEIAAAVGLRAGSVGTVLARAARRLRHGCEAGVGSPPAVPWPAGGAQPLPVPEASPAGPATGEPASHQRAEGVRLP